jgi:hypothetical protein
MRFPTKDGGIDEQQSIELLKAAVDGGVNYFDSAYIYHDGKSEEFTGRFLREHSGLSREQYYIATKLPLWSVKSLDDAKRIFADQLERLQVDCIDFYMLHDLKHSRFAEIECLPQVIDYCLELQKQGKIKHFGFSCHDNYDGFVKLTDYRKWDFVMLYLNYMDTEPENMRMYRHAVTHDIPVLLMETVKGGSLANLPKNITVNFESVTPGRTAASWAIRWAGSLTGVSVILSGMSDMAQVQDNLATCSDFKPLTEAEYAAIEKVKSSLKKRVRNNCTSCNYCMPCPVGVNIPWLFSIWNSYGIYENRGHSNWEYSCVGEQNRPERCTRCGKCRPLCPQDIDIIEDLGRVAKEMDSIKW